jgi:hypothetical protein
MGKMSYKQKNWALALMIVIVLMLSSILGVILLDKERATGGMDVMWTQKTNASNGEIFYMNGSVIMCIPNDKEIKSIDPNGNVAWSYSYSSLISFSALNGHVLIIDRVNDSRFVKCLDKNGTLDWSLEIANAAFGYPTDDGNICVYAGGDGTSTATTNTILCFGVDGSVRWTYSVINGTLGIRLVCPDGTAILQHEYQTSYGTEDANATYERDLISISSAGKVQGMMVWPRTAAVITDFDRADNGTLRSIKYDLMNNTVDKVGLTEDLDPIWSVMNEPMNAPVHGLGSIIYYFRTHSVAIDDWGNERKVTTLYAYNTSDDCYIYQTDFNGSFSGNIWAVGDRVYAADGYGLIWAVDPDGTAHKVQNSNGWTKFGLYDNGLLLFDNYGMRLIGNDGSTAWQYDMESGSILSLFTGANGVIIVVTTDAVTAIHKPTMSMTMTYLMGLVGFDLLVVLTGSIWLLDRRSEEANKM